MVSSATADGWKEAEHDQGLKIIHQEMLVIAAGSGASLPCPAPILSL